MPGRTIAIGDIHGCAKALHALLQAIGPQPDDLLIPLGDYVDRGPDSRGVIDQLLALAGQCRLIPLLGNHEIMMLGALEDANREDIEFWLSCGGQQTLASYGSLNAVPPRHIDFLHGCRHYYETTDHIFLHANYAADQPLGQQPESLLFWEHIIPTPPPPHQSGKTVILGHTPQAGGEIFDLGHLVCIDTHCFGGGWLTALQVQTGQIWQANMEGQLRE